MKKNSIIEKSIKESDLFLYKGFKYTFIVLLADFLFVLVTHKFQLEIRHFAILLGALLCFVPITYYKKSKNKDNFSKVATISLEVICITIFIGSWLKAALVWTITFAMSCLYFNEKNIKKLLIIKVPLVLAANIIIVSLYKNYSIEPTIGSSIEISIYLLFQILMIGYLYICLAKKSNKIFEISIDQNTNIENLLNKSIDSSEKINNNIHELYNSINECNSSLTEIKMILII